MKIPFLKTLTLFFVLIACGVCMGHAESIEVDLIKSPLILVDEEPNETRMPARPIQCVISEECVIIQGYDSDEILSYEVYDLNGACLLSSDDEEAFCTFILKVKDSVEIRLIMEDFILRGYL